MATLRMPIEPDESPALEMTRDEAMRLSNRLRNSNSELEAEEYAGGTIMLALVDFPVSFNIIY